MTEEQRNSKDGRFRFISAITSSVKDTVGGFTTETKVVVQLLDESTSYDFILKHHYRRSGNIEMEPMLGEGNAERMVLWMEAALFAVQVLAQKVTPQFQITVYRNEA